MFNGNLKNKKRTILPTIYVQMSNRVLLKKSMGKALPATPG